MPSAANVWSDRAADAPAGSGDDGDFACELEIHN